MLAAKLLSVWENPSALAQLSSGHEKEFLENA